jgi:hypothetical protein
VSATVTIDQTEHTYSSVSVPGEFDHGHVGPGRAFARCSCGWRGEPVAAGAEVGQWNAHVGVGER